MTGNFKQALASAGAIIFDVDGVLSSAVMPLDANGVPQRVINVHDGYAINLACRLGFPIAIITGGNVQAVRLRFESLGVLPENIYLGAADKVHAYRDFKERYRIDDSSIIYMGDDIPDLNVMRMVGLPVCPRDAAPEILNASVYVSDRDGGMGCARDIIEQVLRAKDLWVNHPEAYTW